jgi:hypothetical protein
MGITGIRTGITIGIATDARGTRERDQFVWSRSSFSDSGLPGKIDERTMRRRMVSARNRGQ